MKQKRKILILTFLLILLTILAIAREYTFVWINAAINNYYRTTNNTDIPSFFLQFEKQELYYLKWLFSFVYGGLNILISIAGILIYFNSRNLVLFMFIVYGLIGLILIVGYGLSIAFDLKEAVYGLLHDLLLLLQTPILFIIVFPILLFYNKHNQ